MSYLLTVHTRRMLDGRTYHHYTVKDSHIDCHADGTLPKEQAQLLLDTLGDDAALYPSKQIAAIWKSTL